MSRRGGGSQGCVIFTVDIRLFLLNNYFCVRGISKKKFWGEGEVDSCVRFSLLGSLFFLH